MSSLAGSLAAAVLGYDPYGGVRAPGRALRLVLFGDSQLSGCHSIIANMAMTGAGRIATFSGVTHGTWPGAPVAITGYNEEVLNGYHTVATRPDATTFTVDLGTAAPAAGTGSATQALFPHRIRGKCWPALLNHLLGNPWGEILNGARSGITTAWMAANIQKFIVSQAPDILFLMGGTNDAFQDVSIDTTMTNLALICERTLAMGTLIFLHTIPPIGPSAASYSAARAAAAIRLNHRIRKYAMMKRGIILLDAFAAAVNSTDANADWLASMSNDDIHGNELWAKTVAAAAAVQCAGLFAKSPMWVSSFIDRVNTDAASDQLCNNPMMTGSGAAGGGWTGNVCSTWTASKTGTLAVLGTTGVARADGIGFDQQMDISGAINGDVCDVLGASFHANVVPGDELMVEMHVTGSNCSMHKGPHVFIEVVYDGVTINCDALSTTGIAQDNGPTFDMVVRSQVMKIPASAVSITICRPRWKANFIGTQVGTAVFKMGRVSVIKNPRALPA